jgi:hypothetical protein
MMYRWALKACAFFRAVWQFLWCVKVREEWFSLGENHEKLVASVNTDCETA